MSAKMSIPANVRFILDHADELKKGNNDLESLNKALDYLKVQTVVRLVEQSVTSNDQFKKDIQATIARLTSELEQRKKEKEELENENFIPAEFTSEEQPPEDVATHLYEQTVSRQKEEFEKQEAAKKEQFEKNKAAEMEKVQHTIENLQEYLSKIENPEQLMQSIVQKELSDIANNSSHFKYLVDICATAMADGYSGMENINGKPLFQKPKNSSFHGYTLNPETAKQFLELVSDEPLVAELNKYYDAEKEVTTRQKAANELAPYAELSLKLEESRQNDDTEKLSQQEDNISTYNEYLDDISKLAHEYEDSCKTFHSKASLVPVPENPFARMFSGLFRKSREQAARANLEEKILSLRSQIESTYDSNKTREENDPEYAIISKSYRAAQELTLLKKDGSDQNLNGFGLSSFIPQDKLLDIRLQVAFADKNLPDERMAVVEKALASQKSEFESRQAEVDESTAKRDRIYASLAPESKEAIDTKKYSPNTLSTIANKYQGPINPGATRYGVSAQVGANILGLITSDLQKEDLEKLGIFADGEVNVQVETINNKIKSVLEQIARDISKDADKHFGNKDNDER